MSIGGTTILSAVVSRCRKIKELDANIVVATTDRPVDDPIVQHCRQHDISVFRGDPRDVAGRALACAEEHAFSHFFRVNADSPLLDATLLSQACHRVECSDYDIITNLHPRSFPYGVSIELVRTAMLRTACAEMRLDAHKENVTQFIYQHMHRYRFVNILRQGENWSTIRLTVDTQEDFKLFTRMVEMSGKPLDSLSYVAAVSLYREIVGNDSSLQLKVKNRDG